MRTTVLTLQSLLLVVHACKSSHAFTLKQTYDATNFFDEFYFRDKAYYDQINPQYHGDPTDGSVLYLNHTQASKDGLINTNNNQVYIGVDHTHVAPRRDSETKLHARSAVRLESKTPWSSGIMIADIAHMPGTACGVWPSLWAYNFDEDPVGEIDIIENVNIQDQNIVSLHTCGTCSFTNIGGTDNRSNCNNGGTLSEQCEDGTNFDGCGNTMSKASYGPNFNAGNGGVYATWLDPSSSLVKIYWWPRKNVPADITAGNPDPSKWGTPASLFTGGKNCNVKEYFKKLTIIINTTFCGDSIDQPTWNDECRADTGAKTCDAYVTNNPSAFKDAYWTFNSIKIYQ